MFARRNPQLNRHDELIHLLSIEGLPQAVLTHILGVTQPGWTTTVVLVSFLFSVQLLMTGVLGEYIGAIHTQVRKRPLVVEKERINFD